MVLFFVVVAVVVFDSFLGKRSAISQLSILEVVVTIVDSMAFFVVVDLFVIVV